MTTTTHPWRRLGRVLLAMAGLLTLTALALVAAFVLAPHLLINDGTLSLTRRVVDRLDLGVMWGEGHIDIKSEAPLVKRLSLTLADVTVARPGLDLSLRHAQVALTLSLVPGGRVVRDVGPIDIDGERLALGPFESESQANEEPLNLRPWIEFVCEELDGPLRVALDEWRFTGGEDAKPKTGSLAFVWEHPAEHRIETQIVLGSLTGLPVTEVNLAGQAELTELGKPQVVDLTLNGVLAAGGRFGVHLATAPATDETFQVDLDASLAQRGKGASGPRRLHLAFDGQTSATAASGTLAFEADAGKDGRLALRSCQVAARSADFHQLTGKVSADCEGALAGVPALTKLPLALGSVREVPFALGTRLEVAIAAGRRFVSGTAALEVPDVTRGPLVAGGKIDLEGRLPLGKGKSDLTADFDVGVRITAFHQLVRHLQASTTPVPAPFNQLAGTASCRAHGKIALMDETFVVPFACATDLASSSQKVATTVDGGVTVTRQAKGTAIDLAVDARLADVQLVFPDLGRATKLPRLTRDPRITGEEKPKVDDRSVRMTYTVTVDTVRPDSLRILNIPYTEGPVPLALDLRFGKDRPMRGSITVGRVDLEVFRRTARVDHVRLGYDASAEERGATLEGRVRIDANDYLVHVDLLGTVAKPQFVLTSEPPLPEEGLVSLLLYGKTPDLLSDDEQKSSESVRAAMTDRAVSLASMYYLASTPIESVGYNPTSGVFTARVRLREGLTLTVGSDTEETSTVGLRRRISPSWSIETTAVRTGDEEHQRGLAMLKWARRY